MTDPKTPRALLRLGALSIVAGWTAASLLAIPTAAAQSRERSAFVLFRADSTSTTMSGSSDDLRRARTQRRGREAMLYVRRGGASYVIRDAAMLGRAQAIFAPQDALGERQSELGAQQSALGDRQSALGAQQAEIGARMAGASAGRADALSREQEALASRQEVLSREQEALGRRQAALGREQERLAREADAKLGALVDEALRRGLATPVR